MQLLWPFVQKVNGINHPQILQGKATFRVHLGFHHTEESCFVTAVFQPSSELEGSLAFQSTSLRPFVLKVS